ncbi:MAG: tetratricopeptide repeat protein [Sandaracinaceae bacterium]
MGIPPYQELLEQARRHLVEGRLEEAAEACRRGLAEHPDDDQLRLILGRALLALGREDEVLSWDQELGTNDGHAGGPASPPRPAARPRPAAPPRASIPGRRDDHGPSPRPARNGAPGEASGPSPPSRPVASPPGTLFSGLPPPPPPSPGPAREDGPPTQKFKIFRADDAPYAPPSPPPARPVQAQAEPEPRPELDAPRRAGPDRPSDPEAREVDPPLVIAKRSRRPRPPGAEADPEPKDTDPSPEPDPHQEPLPPATLRRTSSLADLLLNEEFTLEGRSSPLRVTEFSVDEDGPTMSVRVPSVPVTDLSDPSIPAAPTVPKEAKRWSSPDLKLPSVRVFSAVMVAIVLLGAGGWLLYITTERAAEVQGAVGAAGRSGRESDLERALLRAQTAGDHGLAARLYATLMFEHGEDRGREVTAALASSSEGSVDAAIARAYLQLRDGRPSEAMAEVEAVRPEGDQRAEALRIRALALGALGQRAEALAAARDAVTTRPGSPRDLALLALATHRAGHGVEALQLISTNPALASHPAVRLVRARLLLRLGGDPSQMEADAQAIADGRASSPPERAWAHLILAARAAEDGALPAARVHAEAAAESAPPLDEPFVLLLAETLIRAGAPEEAARSLESLPVVVLNAGERALTRAAIAVALGNGDQAREALDVAPAGPRRDLLLADLLEAEGRTEEARPLYEGAVDAPGRTGRRARVRLATMELADRRAEPAIALLEPALEAAPADLEVASLLARAYLLEERPDDAEQALSRVAAERPSAVEVLAVQGAIALQRERYPQALVSLRQAAADRPDDVGLQLDRADAARLADRPTEAREAYQAALAIDGRLVRAHLGLARLAVDGGDDEEARRHLREIEEDVVEAWRLRGEVALLVGDGAAGARSLREAAGLHEDPDLWSWLGWLYYQGEQPDDAERAFGMALRADGRHPRALLGHAMVDIRLDRVGPAARFLEEATTAAAARGVDLAPLLQTAEAELAHKAGAVADARARIQAALSLEPTLGPAQLLRSRMAATPGEAEAALVAALHGRMPPPAAVARRAVALFEEGDYTEACALGRRYLVVAPRGDRAEEVGSAIGQSCP